MIMKNSEIHLRFAFPDEIQDKQILSRYLELMNDEEKERYNRFRFAKDRHSFLVSRALVRTSLSCFHDIPPRDWQFSRNSYGKPEIISGSSGPRLRFNLSHTQGLIICALMLQQDIGADVENTERKMGGEDIAKRFFSAEEAALLRSLPENQRRDFFFRFWTLKEAYVKARGRGLSLPLDSFSFHIGSRTEIRICFSPQADDSPGDWHFRLFRPTSRHCAALAFRQEKGRDYSIIVKKTVPLLEEKEFTVSSSMSLT